MSGHMAGWLAQVMATDSPALPTLGTMQVWLHLGWSVVLAWLGVWLMGRMPVQWARTKQVQWLVGLCLAAWAWVPGPTGVAYWLGLAFQAPSISGVLLCAGLLGTRFRAVHSSQPTLWLVCLGVLLGWALLLDSFAVLPMQLYAWGFSPVALFLLVVIALLPWVAAGRIAKPSLLGVYSVVPGAALVFVVWRLPTGNIWDAVLDPWVWLVLQVWLLKRGWLHYKNNS